MAILSDTERAELARDLQSELSASSTQLPGVLAQDIRDFVDATDDYQNDNAAAYNATLPASIQALGAAIKTLGFTRVANKRWRAS